MKKYLFLLIILFSFSYSSNYRKQRELVKNIEENISDIRYLIESIEKNKLISAQEKNSLVMSVFRKEKACDEITDILIEKFLKNFIDDDIEKFASINKMLNLCYRIKESLDITFLEKLKKELAHFKEIMNLTYKKRRYKNF
jgi:ferritin